MSEQEHVEQQQLEEVQEEHSKLLTILDLEFICENPERYREKLVEWGLVPAKGTYMCPGCKAPLGLIKDSNKNDGVRWYCGRKVAKGHKKARKCDTYIAYRTGTFMARSKLSIRQILMVVFYWVHHIPLTSLKLEAGVSMKTVIDWTAFCREVILDTFTTCKEKLGGLGKTVEISESKYGIRRYRYGKLLEEQWMFGGYERGSGRVFMVPVNDRSADTLLPIIQEWINPGTTIISDYWQAFDCLSSAGYEHLRVNHSITFKNPEAGAHTNSIEASWQAAKASIGPGGRKSNIAGYLARYMFLKRCAELDLDPFVEFLRLAGRMYNPLEPPEDRVDIDVTDLTDVSDDE